MQIDNVYLVRKMKKTSGEISAFLGSGWSTAIRRLALQRKVFNEWFRWSNKSEEDMIKKSKIQECAFQIIVKVNVNSKDLTWSSDQASALPVPRLPRILPCFVGNRNDYSGQEWILKCNRKTNMLTQEVNWFLNFVWLQQIRLDGNCFLNIGRRVTVKLGCKSSSRRVKCWWQ